MSNRVIAGAARGIKLQLVPGDSTRPIMDRVKESLFNILGDSVAEARILDLFAGTGAVGIEALSRGAAHALFCDQNAMAVKTILANLRLTKLAERGEVRRLDSLAMLAGRPPQVPFDLIYVAPPQYQGLWLKALSSLDENDGWVGTMTQVIVQIDPKEKQSPRLKVLELNDQRLYGKTMLLFYKRKPYRNPTGA